MYVYKFQCVFSPGSLPTVFVFHLWCLSIGARFVGSVLVGVFLALSVLRRAIKTALFQFEKFEAISRCARVHSVRELMAASTCIYRRVIFVVGKLNCVHRIAGCVFSSIPFWLLDNTKSTFSPVSRLHFRFICSILFVSTFQLRPVCRSNRLRRLVCIADWDVFGKAIPILWILWDSILSKCLMI